MAGAILCEKHFSKIHSKFFERLQQSGEGNQLPALRLFCGFLTNLAFFRDLLMIFFNNLLMKTVIPRSFDEFWGYFAFILTRFRITSPFSMAKFAVISRFFDVIRGCFVPF